MYGTVLVVHSLLRWLVLLAVVGRVGRGAMGWAQGAPFTDVDKRLSLATIILVDLQLTLGVILFAVSPIVQHALSDPGAAMKDSAVRLVFVEHPLTMVIAVVLVHVGHALAKRGTVARSRHRMATLLTLAAFILMLSRIPW